MAAAPLSVGALGSGKASALWRFLGEGKGRWTRSSHLPFLTFPPFFSPSVAIATLIRDGVAGKAFVSIETICSIREVDWVAHAI